MSCDIVLADGSLAGDGVAFYFVSILTGQTAVDRRGFSCPLLGPVREAGMKIHGDFGIKITSVFLFGVVHQIRKTKACFNSYEEEHENAT